MRLLTRRATKYSTSSRVFKIHSENTSRDENDNFSTTTAMLAKVKAGMESYLTGLLLFEIVSKI